MRGNNICPLDKPHSNQDTIRDSRDATGSGSICTVEINKCWVVRLDIKMSKIYGTKVIKQRKYV